MVNDALSILKRRLEEEEYQKLAELRNSRLTKFVAKYFKLCNPDDVFVCTDSQKDIQRIRDDAIQIGEERELALKGHTIHFDGYDDQARDKEKTKLLMPAGADMGPNLNSIDREKGLKEIHEILENIMRGRRLYIKFFSLGPIGSPFSIPAVQLTDSPYVVHSEGLLYRKGYETFKELNSSEEFFKFVHSEGKLKEGVSKNVKERRIYIDTLNETIYSANTQYGGNSIGPKKLAMRLAIKKASEEGWLTEHMFVIGVQGLDNRKTYFAGAYPSMCGKTSTSMIEGESIVGDDIAYLREIGGKIHAINPEKGIYGILRGVNSKDEPLLWKALQKPGEIIFSNALMTEDREAYWIGKNGKVPKRGVNHSGKWFLGKKDAEGKVVPPSHKNARFTFNLNILDNLDAEVDNPSGVELGGIIYGNRDSDVWLPTMESFNWTHGVITIAASLETETTAATLDKEGVRKFNPMSNLDFLSIPIGEYIKNHLKFGAQLNDPPKIFSVNYFLRDLEGNFLTDKADKAVWLKWMELRSNREIGSIKTPIGLIPRHRDLRNLFQKVLGKDYSKKDYIDQFTLRIPENLAKIHRIMRIYETEVPDAPNMLFVVLKEQKRRLTKSRNKYGNYISPEKFE